MSNRFYKLPFFLVAFVAVVVPVFFVVLALPPTTAAQIANPSAFIPTAFAAKWVYWLLIWSTLMLLPLFLAGAKDLRAPFFFGSVAVPIFLFLFAIFQFRYLMVCAFALAAWQAFWWCSSRHKTFKSPTFWLHSVILTMAWIATYFYFCWACSIAHSGVGFFCSLGLSAILVLVVMPLCIWWTARPFSTWAPARTFSHRLLSATLTIGALCAFIFESLRVDRIEPTTFYHHWGVYIGPLQQMHEGGWLLWDIPSQYGFFSLVLLGLSPLSSGWSSLYWVNAFFVFLEAALLFFFLKKVWPTLWGTLGAFCITFISMYLLTGWLPKGTGPLSIPSISGFRFAWVAATIVFLVLRDQKESGLPRKKSMKLGENVLFLGSMLWSAESFFYCGMVWGAYFWGQWLVKSEARAVVVRQAVEKVGVLLLTMGFISIFYLVRLGHFPDWRMFIEYAFSFGTGFFSLPMEFPGPGLYLLYFSFLVALSLCGWFGPLRSKLGIILASFSALWGCVTYYVGRSHFGNAVCVIPLVLISGTAILRTVEKFPNIKSQLFLWMSPLLYGICLMALLSTQLLPAYMKGLRYASFFNIERFVPSVTPEVKKLLDRIPNIEEARVVSWQDQNLPGKYGPIFLKKTWLPLSPLALYQPLKRSRTGVFLRRRLERLSGCGWVLYDTTAYPHAIGPIHEFDNAFLEFNWVPRKYFENGSSQLILWCKDGKLVS